MKPGAIRLMSKKTVIEYKARIEERGNGMPTAGDYVAGNDGQLYRIVEIGYTHAESGKANWAVATVELANWQDTENDNEIHTAQAFVNNSVIVSANRYEDYDDSLAAAIKDYAYEHGFELWQVEAKWADEQRDEIVLTIND